MSSGVTDSSSSGRQGLMWKVWSVISVPPLRRQATAIE
jgi:hypothetical protein